MAPQLGKRKRVTREQLERPSRSPSPAESSDNEDMQELFRRAFEKKFKPLDVEPVRAREKKNKSEEAAVVRDEEEGEEEKGSDDAADEDEDEDDWSGLSDDDNDDGNDATTTAVEVVEYKDPTLASTSDDEATLKAQKRAFMSSKPPVSSTSTLTTSKKPSRPGASTSTAAEASESTDAAHLKNDLALQKLLRDSHLLSASASASSSGASTPTGSLLTTGAARHRSTDLHLQSLGAKRSVFTQKNMPMAQRKHMLTKARETEAKRRSDAREGGIILEKEKREPRKDVGRRERGVGMPSVGRFKGGTLSLSKADVRSITGGPGSQGGRGGKAGRGGRGGGGGGRGGKGKRG